MKDIDAQIVGLPKSFYDANGYVRLRGTHSNPRRGNRSL